MSAPSVSVTSATVSKSSYTSDCLSIASAYLEGETDSYYLFQYDDDVYVLLIGDLDYIQGSVTSSECTAVVIWREVSESRDVVEMDVNGSFDGSFSGFQERGITHGSTSGTLDFVNIDTTVAYFTAVSTVTDVSVSNPDFRLVYSSFPNSPHLIEGVQNYAFAGFILCFAVFAFKLADRLFRRIY